MTLILLVVISPIIWLILTSNRKDDPHPYSRNGLEGQKALIFPG